MEDGSSEVLTYIGVEELGPQAKHFFVEKPQALCLDLDPLRMSLQ